MFSIPLDIIVVLYELYGKTYVKNTYKLTQLEVDIAKYSGIVDGKQEDNYMPEEITFVGYKYDTLIDNSFGEAIYFSLEYLLACSRNPDEGKVVNDAVNAKLVSDVCTAIDFAVEKINLNTMLKYVSKYVEMESKIE